MAAEYIRLEDCHFLHPGKSASVLINGKYAGFIGALHPDILEKLDIKNDCYVAEIDFSLLLMKHIIKMKLQNQVCVILNFQDIHLSREI